MFMRFLFLYILLFSIRIHAEFNSDYIGDLKSPSDYEIYAVFTSKFKVGNGDVICALFFLPSFNKPDPFAIFIRKKEDKYLLVKCIYRNNQIITKEYPINSQLADNINNILQAVLPYATKTKINNLDGIIYLFECISVNNSILRGEIYSSPEIPPTSTAGLLMYMTEGFGIGDNEVDYFSIKKISDELHNKISYPIYLKKGIWIIGICIIMLSFLITILYKIKYK